MQRRFGQSGVRNTGMMGSGVGSNQMRRSVIATSHTEVHNGEDLRKSRIQNLPNYKKTNLWENINSIVVFQTIEIERLSAEVEFLRVKVKQYEREIFNAKNYEVQIRQLTQQCLSMQRQRGQYREELEKLNKICENLYHENQMLKAKLNQVDTTLKHKYENEKAKNADLAAEIEKWKARYQAAEKGKAKEIDDLRNLMDCQRKSMLDRQMRQLTIRFQNERSNLQNEIRKLREALENKNRDLDECKQKIRKLETQVMQLRNYEDVVADLNRKNAQATQELMRLNETLKPKAEEVENLRKNQYDLKKQLKEQQQWQFQNKQLRNALDNRQKDIQNLRTKLSRLEDELHRSREMQHYNEELNNKLGLASKQLDRLNDLIKAKMDQIGQWKKRCSDKDIEMSHYKNMENQIPNFQNKINSLKLQNDRINGILKSRLEQVEGWKDKCNEAERKLGNLAKAERDKSTLQNRLNDQIRQNESLQEGINRLQNELRDAQRLKPQLQKAERKNEQIAQEMNRLNNAVQNKNKELDDFRNKHQNMENALKDYRNIQTKMKDDGNKIGLLTQEIDRLNQLISSKNKEIERLQNQVLNLHTQANNNKNYQQRIAQAEQASNRYKNQLQDAKRDLQAGQNKIREADGKKAELEDKLFKMNQEKEKANNALKSKNNQLEDLRKKCSRAEGDSRKAREYENMLEEQHVQLKNIVAENDDSVQRVKFLTQALDKEKQYTDEFALKIIILSSQIERLTKDGGSGGMKSKEVKQMQENVSRMGRNLESKNNEVQLLLKKVANLEASVAQLKGQFNRLLTEVQRSEKETLVLARQVEEYQDYARRIHILGAEIDRLKAENKNLDEDAKKIRLKYADRIKAEEKEEIRLMRQVILAAEVDSLRMRLEERQMDHEEMRKSILEPIRRI